MKIPLFPLDVVLFPGAALPLHIFEARYKEMIAECLRSKHEFGVVRARRDGLATIGCTAAIVSILGRYPDGRMDILCRGERRFEIESLNDSRSFLQAEIDFVDDDGKGSTRADRERCVALHMEMLELSGSGPDEFLQLDLDMPVSYLLASSIPSDLEYKQELLHMRCDEKRTRSLIEFYGNILPKLRRGAMMARVANSNGHVM